MVKLIFFDIDGTLVTHQNKIPSSTKTAIQQLKEKGIIPIIATGRAPLLLEEVRKELEISSFIAMNGQYVVLEGEVIYKNALPNELVDRLTKYAASQKDGVVLCGEDQLYGNSMSQIMRRGSLVTMLKKIKKFIPRTLIKQLIRKMRHRPVNEKVYKDKTVYQVIIQTHEDKDESYIQAFPELHFARTNRYGIDVVQAGMSKAIAIEKVLKYYNLPIEETMAFGDGLNDIEMFRMVHESIAMGNGHVEAKKHAARVTDTVNNDGIYKALIELKIL